MDLKRTNEVLLDGIHSGLHHGAQIYVSLRGKAVADTAIGTAWRPVDTPAGIDPALRSDYLVPWMSSSKPIGAAAIAQLWERGLIDLDAPVGETIPEFAQGGKEAITLRHILTHTGGFRAPDVGMIEPDWDDALRKTFRSPVAPGWVVGKTAGYDPWTSWFVIGEMVGRVDGRPYPEYVREAIFEPLGMQDCWVGMPPEAYAAYGDRLTPVYDTTVSPPTLTALHELPSVTSCAPAASGRGPVQQLGRFYEALLNDGLLRDARILKPGTVGEFTRPHRVGMFDSKFERVVDWGLGFVLRADQSADDPFPYGYGPHASAAAFGHGGRQSVVSFADPKHDLVVAIWFNGMAGDPAHARRNWALLEGLYDDLGLT
jgi:CubicO group peptidase (beta-lactamase class C family)